MTALPTFATEANALQADVNSKQTLAAASQTASATSEANAASSAAAAAGSANVTLWVSGTTYAQNASVISPANHQTYRRTSASGSGTTDPSTDNSNYVLLTGSGMVLLASVVPTVSANIDFLTLFSNLYTNYLVVFNGIVPSANDNIRAQLATGGSIVALNYFNMVSSSTTSVTGSTGSVNITSNGSTVSSGKGVSGTLHILNTTDTVNDKQVISCSMCDRGSAAYAYSNTGTQVVNTTSAVSGIRFFWSAGANFTAVGSIRIYGMVNS